MTDTPTQPHRSEEVTLALLNHRMKAVEVMCARSVEQGDQLLANQGKIDTQLAVGAEKMKDIDKTILATNGRVDILEADRRGAHGFWTAIAGTLTAIGSFLYALTHGK